MGPALLLCSGLLLLSCSAPCRSEWMVLGGLSVPHDCSSSVEKLQEEVRGLKTRGVDHVPVQLNAEALFSDRSCLLSLLSALVSSDLHPLLLLDLQSLLGPSAVVPGSRPGAERLLRSSLVSVEREEDLRLMFEELGQSAQTWLLLLEPNSPEQLELYQRLQQIFTGSGHRISLALKSDLSSVTPDLYQLPMDFLSVRVELDCNQGAEPVLADLQKVSREVPVLIYSFETKHCSEQQLTLFKEQIQSEVNIVGSDAAAILDLKPEEAAQIANADVANADVANVDVANAVVASEVRPKYTTVWDKFSHWNIFESKKYHWGTFPDGFLWGVFSSAYQIEGGWNADGKGPSIWDTFTQNPGPPNTIPEATNGNIACDSYNMLDQDLALIQNLKVNSYRFSISWSRLFPDGVTPNANPAGVDYYNRLINGLLSMNVAPVVTLYHWDLPQALQNTGGWENENLITLFNQYAEFCFQTFGDRVKFWITFNDPYNIAWEGYGSWKMPPNVNSAPGYTPYKVGRVLLLAHAAAYRTYDTSYKPTQGGVVSIALNADWFEPKDASLPRDVDAADRILQFRLGWFAHPIFVNGDYPEVMKAQVGGKSDLQNLPTSRLPAFTEEDKLQIKGTADVFCLNHHTTKLATFALQDYNVVSFAADWDVVLEELPQYPETGIPGILGPVKAIPWGLRRALYYTKMMYGDKDVYITDNALGTETNFRQDDFVRVFFLNGYIAEALKAQNLDGVKVKGYLGVPLMDSFEWLVGYIMGSGLHLVDPGTKARTPKYSTDVYKTIVSQNGLPPGDVGNIMYDFFRDDMMWSSATASFQIEGGWRSDGKGLSIWDKFSHTPGKVRNNDNGDMACDSYNRMDEDIRLLQEIGVKYYRFSIAWARVLPDGVITNVNEAGVDYYVRLVDALTAAGIQPQVTLYHWDLPQALQNNRGWENEAIIQQFVDYAELMFTRLGPKVKIWITFNEPWIVALLGYGYGNFAPGVNADAGRIPYNVAHNIIKAHAEAWHTYNEKYRPTQQGKISITLNSDWAEPRNPTKASDITAANQYLQFFLGWFAHPIFRGDYPPIMKQRIAERSFAVGLPKSRLPEFTPEEVRRINGTHDFFGLNHYTSVLAFMIDYPIGDQVYDADRGTGVMSDWNWVESGSNWLRVTPFGLRRLLKFIKEEYGDPEIIVTENGVSEQGPVEDLNDGIRQYYYTHYINQALKALKTDNVKLVGYTAWSLMDNFEWAEGYNERFGLVYVNRSDKSLPRTPKHSVKTYNQIIRCNGYPDPSSGNPCLKDPSVPTGVAPTDPAKPPTGGPNTNPPPPPTGPKPTGPQPTGPAPTDPVKPPTGGPNTKPPPATKPDPPTKPNPPTKPPVTKPPPASKPPPMLRFLGMELTQEEAEAGLNTTFALFVVSVVGILGAGVGFFMCRGRSKKGSLI